MSLCWVPWVSAVTKATMRKYVSSWFRYVRRCVYSVSVNLNTNIRKRNDMCVFKSHNIIVFGLKLHCTMEIWYLSNETVIGYGVQIIIKKNIGFLFFLRTCRIIAIESILYILYADLNLQKWSPTELMRYHPVGECLGQVVLSRTNNGNIVEFVTLAQLNKLGSI
jgi:hypothetical protein